MQIVCLGWEDPLEREMATHSSVFAWEIHEQRSLEGSSPWGHKKVTRNWAIEWQQFFFSEVKPFRKDQVKGVHYLIEKYGKRNNSVL